MSAKAHSKRAGNPVQVAPEATSRARRGANGRMPARVSGDTRSALPTMRAATRRRDAACSPDAKRTPRKAKRAKRTHSLGGRLAAAIRVARLRASRAAEEFGRRR